VNESVKAHEAAQTLEPKAEADLSSRHDLEKILLEISSRLNRLEPDQIDRGIHDILTAMGEFANVDRSYIFLMVEDGDKMEMIHEWHHPSIAHLSLKGVRYQASDYPWWMARLAEDREIHLPNLEALPIEAAAEKELLQAQSARSILAIPIFFIDDLFGFIGLTNLHQEREWTEDQIALLKIVGGMISNLLMRLRAFDEVRSQRDFAMQVMNAMGQGLVVGGEDGRFEYINPAFAEMLAYPPEELIGKTPFDITEPLDQEVVRQAHEKRVAGLSNVYEIRMLRKDGEQIYALVNAVPHWQNGKVVGSIAVVTDLTRQKHVEQALRRSESAMRNLYSIASDQKMKLVERIQALLVMGCQHFNLPQGVLIRRNVDHLEVMECISQQLGLKPGQKLSEAEARSLGIPLPQSKRESLSGLVARIYRDGGEFGFLAFFGGDLNALTASISDQEFLHLMAQWCGSEIERGRQLHQLRNYANEIQLKNKDLARANEIALEAAQMKADFLATMSHEIRTPLNSVIGMSELILTTQLDERQQEYATAIRESSGALLDLINDILDFSKIESGRLVLEQVDFQLAMILEGTADLLAGRAAQKNLALMTYIDPAIPPMLNGDPGRLRQVLLNLIGNAVKFTKKGEVVISAIQEQRGADEIKVTFKVRDTGIGISESARKNLFQPFVQADSSMARKYGGSGLGLSISRHLVNLMGGEIGVESIEGKGSTFWFSLPFKRSQATVPITPRRKGIHFDKMNILTVAGNATQRDILRRYFDSWGLLNRNTDNGDSALQKLEEAQKEGSPFNIIMIDTFLPDQSGLDLGKAIKAKPELANAHLILLMGLDESTEPDEETDQHVFDLILKKPIKQSPLFDALANIMSTTPFPVDDAEQTQNKPTGPLERSSSQRRPLILIVEDNPANQKIVVYQLDKLGCNGHTVGNGYEAVEILRTVPDNYALVLMDCQMPEIDGFETTILIRKNESENGRHIPIVAMTANAMPSDRKKCLQSGMDDYLAKPVTLKTLKDILTHWLPPLEAAPDKADTKPEKTDKKEEVPMHEAIRSDTLQEIRKLQGDVGGGLLVELIDLYLEEAPGLLDKMNQAILSKDAGALQFAAHRLKGSSAYLGLQYVTEICQKLENDARDGNLQDSSQDFKKLFVENELAFKALQHEKEVELL